MHTSVLFLLTLLLSLTPTYARHPPTSFCKCICFTNSTIIPLNSSPHASSSPSTTPSQLLRRADDDDNDEHDETQTKRLTCADCTRAFCLDSNLPICQGAKEEDVFTSCFQRDSLKDETIVLLFLVTTAGLLGWAMLKPWVDKLRDTETVQRYAPVGNLNLGRLAGRSGGGLPAYREDGERSRTRTRDRRGSESFARQGGLNS